MALQRVCDFRCFGFFSELRPAKSSALSEPTFLFGNVKNLEQNLKFIKKTLLATKRMNSGWHGMKASKIRATAAHLQDYRYKT